jgi:hypothetical protein
VPVCRFASLGRNATTLSTQSIVPIDLSQFRPAGAMADSGCPSLVEERSQRGGSAGLDLGGLADQDESRQGGQEERDPPGIDN